MKPYYIFSINKNGHYEDYAKVLSSLISAKVIRSTIQQLKISFSSNSIIFLDGDSFHLLFFPIIVLRSLLGYKNYLFSIRTERVLDVPLQKLIKLPIYKLLKSFTNTRIISIHKDNIRAEYHSFVTDFIFDIQYWDLKYLDLQSEQPIELNNLDISNTISIIGEFNNKKSRKELISFLKVNKGFDFKFLFAGKIFEEDLAFLKNHQNCIVLDRYISNEEILFIYENSKLIWCYYSNDVERPSGIFGRAIQLKKHAIVREDGHLHKSNFNNPNLIKIREVKEMLNINFDLKIVNWENSRDSSIDLLKILDQDLTGMNY